MNHSFVPSQLDTNKCASCRRSQIDHSELAKCDCCDDYIGKCELIDDMLMCPRCTKRQAEITAELAQHKDNPYKHKHEDLDTSIQTSKDFWNSRIASFEHLKKAIDDDITIIEKEWELAQRVKNRIGHLKEVLFPQRKLELEAVVTEHRMLQTQLNVLASKITKEQREKLKISDINYVPTIPKISKPKAPSIKKFDKVELRKYAAELGVGEYTLQGLAVAKNITVAEAAGILRESLAGLKAVDKE